MPITKVPFKDYLKLDALSASDIVNISRTPRDYLKGKNPKEQTPGMLLGSVLHCLVLEPSLFDRTYVIEPTKLPSGEPIRKPAKDGSMRKTLEGKQYLESLLLDGRTLIPASVFEDAMNMWMSLAENERAPYLLQGSHAEQIALWNKEGVACKGQIDAYKDRILIDLKTTSNIDPVAFEADSYRRRYHQKMAWYKEGLEANGIPIDTIYLIVVSQSECIVRRMNDDLIDRGRMFNEKAFETFVKCKKENYWPSWPAELSLGIPGFALYDPTLGDI